MEDFARKVGKCVVEVGEDFSADVIKLENLKNLVKSVNKLPKDFRDKLYLMQYRRVEYWIVWKEKKHNLIVEFVNPKYSSVSCSRCGKKMEEVDYRYFLCPSCGYENDRDVVAIVNLNGKGVSGSLVYSSNDVNRIDGGNDEPSGGGPSPFRVERKSEFKC